VQYNFLLYIAGIFPIIYQKKEVPQPDHLFVEKACYYTKNNFEG